MRLTKRSAYALRALIYLGAIHATRQKMFKIADLAKHQRIPIKFLEAILVQLNRAGYIASKRGKAGGIWLRRPADKIKIGEVIRKLEPDLAPIQCASRESSLQCTCPDVEHCPLRMLMREVHHATSTVLDSHTLADLARVESKEPLQQQGRPSLGLKMLGIR